MRLKAQLVLIALILATVGCGSPGESPAPATPAPDPAPRPAAPAPAWDQFGGGAARSRSTADSGPVSEPGIVWSALTEQNMATEPVFVTAGSRRLVLVSGARSLWAVDLKDGTEAWVADVSGPVSTAPSVSGDRIWVGSLDGFGVMLDAATGAKLQEYEADFTLEAASLMVGGLVVFEETARSGSVPTSRLHAVDTATLEMRWQFDYVKGTGCSPASDGERVFVHAADGVTALSLADGTQAWRHERVLRRQPLGPSVAGGRVVVQSVSRLPSGYLTALDARSGELLWEVVLPMRALGAPALTDDGLFLVLGSGKLQRRDPASGALTWESVLPDFSETAPVVTAAQVIVGGEGYVAAFDRKTGVPAWTVPIDGEAVHLSVDGDSVFVATLEGFLHRLASAS